MSQINQAPPMAAFQAASGIDPVTLRGVIVAIAIAVVLAWGTYYLRRVLAHGWNRMDPAHMGTGLFLLLMLLVLIFWVAAEYGKGP